MKASTPTTQFSLWRSQQLFNIGFACYELEHHSFPRHFHDHYVIELVLKGADDFYCDGTTYQAYADQLVLINPGEVHTGSTLKNTALQYFSFYPDKKTLQQVAEALNITLPADHCFTTTLQDRSSVTQKMQLLFNSLQTHADPLHQQEVFFDCMRELLNGQHGNTETVPDKKDPRIKILVDFLHSHYAGEITLQQMARIVNLDPSHLIRLFKKNTGISPYDYVLILRTEHAKTLLGKGYKVQDAAQDAGFYDSSHFNRSLRKMAGTSPRSFLSSKSQYRTSLSH